MTWESAYSFGSLAMIAVVYLPPVLTHMGIATSLWYRVPVAAAAMATSLAQLSIYVRHQAAASSPWYSLTLVWATLQMPPLFAFAVEGDPHALPGRHVHPFLARVLSRQALQLIVEPLLADVQEEWIEAMAAGRLVDAQKIRACGYPALLQSLAILAIAAVCQAIRYAWRALRSKGAK